MYLISATAIALCLASIVSGQNPASETVVQIVQVSDTNGTLAFFPDQITADVGSVVQFQFYPKNHTITESSFAAPCVPIAANLTTPTRPGQKSGFVPVTADTQFRPVYNLIVNDTKPMWIFCGQQPHCIKGMSMVINQNMSDTVKTLQNYKAAAAQLPLPAASSSAASAATTAAAVSTVTPVSASTAGPSLAGSTTTTDTSAQSGTASASIGTFTGGAPSQRQRSSPILAGALLGAVIAVL